MQGKKDFNTNQLEAFKQGLKELNTLFWGPDLVVCERICNGDFFAPWHSLAEVMPPEFILILDEFNAYPKRFASVDILCEALQDNYVSLFVTNKAGVPAPLYQSCYLYEGAPLMGPPAIDMQRRFTEAGLLQSDSANEPPDHLAIEIEFLYFLLDKAQKSERAEDLNIVYEFCGEVLLAWLPKLEKALDAENDGRFFALAVGLLNGALRMLCPSFSSPESA